MDVSRLGIISNEVATYELQDLLTRALWLDTVLIELFEIHLSRMILVISLCRLNAVTPASLITTVRFSSAGPIFLNSVLISSFS